MKNEFWRNKIGQNRKRDRKTRKFLREKGWEVLRIWEHEARTRPNQAISNIKALLRIK
jgi:DNA mismatch endonuclease (patch repair protein)